MVFFYAVARGRNPGIYSTWEECRTQVNKYPCPVFKKFPTKEEAEDFVATKGSSSSKDKPAQGICAANAVPKNYRSEKAVLGIATKIKSPYDEIDNRLKDWAKDRRCLSQIDVQSEATRIANALGIKNFNPLGGWLKYHLECNPVIYKSLRVQKNDEEFQDVAEDLNSNVAQKLSSLERKIVGLSTSGGSIPSRIRILEHTLHSLHQELHEIKRYMSTDTCQGSSVTSNKRKRKKVEEPGEDECSENISDSSESSDLAYSFHQDENGYVNVFTDGACSNNGRSGAAAGIGVWFGDNHPLNVSRPVAASCRATNNLAEIQAVTEAAKQATKAGVKKLKVNTDSQFLISCITQWMPKWKRTGWRKADGGNVINKEELIEMEKALKPLTIAWNHIRGHAGIHGNEMADQLARAGAAAQRKK